MAYAIISPEIAPPLRMTGYFSGPELDFNYLSREADGIEIQNNPDRVFEGSRWTGRVSTYKSSDEMDFDEIYRGILEECLEYVTNEEEIDSALAAIMAEVTDEDAILTP